MEEFESRLEDIADIEPDLELELSLVEEEYFGEREERTEEDSENEDDGLSNETEWSPGASTVFEMRDLDEEEVQMVRQFSTATCGCTKKHGEPCSGFFTESELGKI